LLLAMSIVFTAVGAATPARADVDSDTAAITNRLLRSTEAFNARDAAAVCDVFAPT
jgi:steroid delta-isomerase